MHNIRGKPGAKVLHAKLLEIRALLQATLGETPITGKFYSSPGKGCLLTYIQSTGKVIVLSIHEPELKLVAAITSSSHHGSL